MRIALGQRVFFLYQDFLRGIKVRQHPLMDCIAQLPLFDNAKYGIYHIYFNLISLDSQIEILFNDIKYYVAVKQKTLFRPLEYKKKTSFTIILCVNISYTVFNENAYNFQDMYKV